MIQYRKYKDRIEYVYQILKLVSIRPLTHSQLKAFTENSNSESFKRHVAPLVQHQYMTRSKEDNAYHITEKGMGFLAKLESIAENMVELNHQGFEQMFLADFLQFQAEKLKGEQQQQQ